MTTSIIHIRQRCRIGDCVCCSIIDKLAQYLCTNLEVSNGNNDTTFRKEIMRKGSMSEIYSQICQATRSMCSLSHKSTAYAMPLIKHLPANQPAFLIRYPRSILSAQIDHAYVVFPNIAKKKRAGDKPSHRVLKFFTTLRVSDIA